LYLKDTSCMLVFNNGKYLLPSRGVTGDLAWSGQEWYSVHLS